jgi:phosphatidylinositol alpha-mannosyltransferase
MTARLITFAANQGDIGGGEVMLLNLAVAARDLGLDVDVVGPRSSGVLEAAEEAGFVVHGLGATRRDYLLALRRWRGRGKFLWANGLAPAFATSAQRGRVVHLHQQPRGKQAVASRAARFGARITLVPSRSMARDVPGTRVLENWTAEVRASTARPAAATPVIGFIGRPSVDKGVVVLADALHLLSQRRATPPRLLLAGEPRFVAAGERRTVEAALSRVEHLVDRVGWIAPDDFFARVDLAAFPSVWPEPFGLVVAESMSAQVPFVVSDAGALPEVAGPAHPWVVPRGDAAALADTIEAVLASPSEVIEGVVTSARRRWESHFSPAAGRTRLAELLQELDLT